MILFLEETNKHLDGLAFYIVVPHSHLVLRLALIQYESVEHESLSLEAEQVEDLRKFLFLLRQIHLFLKVLYGVKD